jgi:molybdenum cofactor cytidylyltransferase
VILAGGLSRRMGRNKLLVAVEGTPMVRRAAEAALAGGLDPVVVVVRSDAADVRRALEGLHLMFAHTERPEAGLSASLRVGIAALRGHRTVGGGGPGAEVAAAVVLLGDMPWVEPSHVRHLVEAFDAQAGRAICVPVHAGRRGNPVLWGARYFPELMSLTGDVGARSLLARHAADVYEVPVAGDGVLRDVDTDDALPSARANG